MALSVRYCSGCRALTHPSQSACPSCGSSIFTNATVNDPNSELTELEQSPSYIHLKSALGNSELYLRAIANFLSVIWLFFIASVVGSTSSSLVILFWNKYTKCFDAAYQTSSCKPFGFAAIVIGVAGGLVLLFVLGLAWGRGWLAYRSIRRAEKP